METHTAYCSACDARVEVGFDPGGSESGPPARVRCLDGFPACGGSA